jgi:hypothetical protein
MKVILIASIAIFLLGVTSCNAYLGERFIRIEDANSKGVDMSGVDCSAMTMDDWACLNQSGFVFAILEAWEGGRGYSEDIGKDQI